jgi:hypothetical protein
LVGLLLLRYTIFATTIARQECKLLDGVDYNRRRDVGWR